VLRVAALILAGALLAVGCGSDDGSETPVACLTAPAGYLDALEAAPGDVRLEGTTPISECLVDDQESGPLAQVGESMIAAATRLNRDLRDQFDPEVATRLGYLIGAVQAGATDTGGIHEDLVLRLDAAARFTGDAEPFGARFERAFGQGYGAGQERG
jgi:hypothetical protein